MGNAGRVLMIPKGAYNASTTYNKLDVVLYEGDSYVAKATTTGNLPTNTIYWQPMTAVAEEVNSLKETLTNFEESITGEVVDSEPYVLRQGLGNLADMTLVGGSVAWNQLCNGSSVTVPNGHKYYMRKSGTTSIGASTGSAITGLTSGTDNVIDLTQLFGTTTIADYIYALEQATAGAGVAWFRQYFPNDYYGYDAGSIQSVNPSARIASKNLFDPSKFVQGLLNWQNGKLENAAQWITSNFIPTYGNSKVALSGYRNGAKANFCARFSEYDANFTFIKSTQNISISDVFFYSIVITLNANTRYVRASFGFNNEATTPSAFFATNDIQLEFGDAVTAYEDYDAHKVVFDSSKQLRGIPKLVDNKLSYDGDIYTADGTVTRKYGIVDLGSLSYTAASVENGTLFYTANNPISNMKNTALITDIANAVCILGIKRQSDINSGNAEGLSIGPDSSRIRIFSETTYKNMTSEQFKAAMSGVYLVYELATPTTESASPFQNPQRAFIDGTEEFVDAGVTSGTRDVSIPVGNNTTYQLNETLPPTEDYVDGALKFKAAISALGTDESGRTTASRAYTAGEFFYKDGKMYKVLTSIAQGATFTINTNCQQTTLFAELKALAQ